ncbi:unnamed protein product [Bursaphelenchus okinawaensis]|uniref:Phosphatidylglycerophosphatase and protein-tyrosine phosphatase 1 n=1 Tax=Bursaphelenchus okinawaensis TaxID=465554 RepID=A0A811K8K0_9BILA|nr:unnamed protein product [Bursaphelenchus okinawaensis]CAG9095047.1 unnamed protein product [Bursaphelenchus okinawaensis]
MMGHIAFYPTLAYNLARNLIQPQSWKWYNRVDESLILGALPFRSMVEELKQEKVAGIVCCTEEFETKAAYNGMGKEEWTEHGIQFHHVPMLDFVGTTSTESLHSAVTFIDHVASQGNSVYVHCKAGRTRSATVAMCYLMFKKNLQPQEAFQQLQARRPQVILRSSHWRSVADYRSFLDNQNN